MANSSLVNAKTILLGWIFVGYALFCLLLAFALSSEEAESTSASVVGITLLPKPDFATIEQVQDKKAAFFDFMLPIVEAENKKIQLQRQRLLSIHSEFLVSGELSRLSQHRLERLRDYYRLSDSDLDTKALLDRLLIRVDEVPVSMVLAQAAIESAWGTSRFATEANNFFGQWCFVEGCGLVPNQRPEDAYHEVAKFKSVQASVASYLRNINTHNAYRKLRQTRATMRDRGNVVSSLALIEELKHYSERGSEYIQELRQIISVNQLTQLETPPDQA